MTPNKAVAQIGIEAQRAHWILSLSNYVIWPEEDNIKTFTIGVYGYNVPELEYLEKLVESKTIKDKKFTIQHFKRVKEITFTEILYVNPSYNDDLSMINSKVKGLSTLVITADIPQNSNLESYSMINLLLKGRGRQFVVYSNKAKESNLIIPDRVLAEGGSRGDLINLVESRDKELQVKENQLKVQEQEINAKEQELKKQTLANDIQRDLNQTKSDNLEFMQKEIEIKKRKANVLLSDAENLKEELFQNGILLRKQEQEINDKQHLLTQNQNELRNQKNMINQRSILIDEQEKRVKDQIRQISEQDKTIRIALYSAGFILTLVLITTFLNRSRKKKNRLLEMRNDEVERNKDQILAQSDQLKQINKELEKLSIVASQTDNGVAIMDNVGNIEWVNRGFSNMYGYNLSDLQNLKRSSLSGFYSSNSNIQVIIDECLSSSESRVFETEIIKKDGNNVWVQSTLTPILNEKNEISRLVTIDTDITQIKEQEMAIIAQGATLAAQRDELQEQKEFISEQNAHINTSLTYAKTIQETVMPLEVNITKCYNYFGLFIPLQIVSGDFYWFTRIPGNDNLTFLAAVDCTGHGVPGAFMCMISTRLLNEIIVEHQNYDTKTILSMLNTGLIAALKQDTTDNNDSLEICLCKVLRNENNEDYEITFSGAKRPLYYYRQNTKEFDSLKADRKTIGGIMSKRNSMDFTSETINLIKGDKIYMTTDGFINQFDINNKKYGSDRFVNLLKSVVEMELPEQKTILEQEFYKYKGDAEQNDDITIFAVQLI